MQHRVMRAAALVLLLAAACSEHGPLATIATASGPVPVRLEVVATPEARARGLMYRTELADGDGMLFVFDREEEQSFWMKNTFIPLDIVFIAGDGRIVGIHENARPMSTAMISVGRPSRLVLEVPGGWTAKHGVAAGQQVELRGVPLP
jgi:uncharacterized membrane protein (UPF0127 family)